MTSKQLWMGQGQSSPVSCCLVSCFFQSAFAANEVCSVQKVQNQGPPSGDVVVNFGVENGMDTASLLTGGGEHIDSVLAGLKASDVGDAAVFVGSTPDR